MTKLYAQRKDGFDINKVTVVGSPTITSDGILSGITSTSYVNCGQGLLVGANTWEIEFEYDTTNMPETGVGTIFNNVSLSPTYTGLVIQGRAGRINIYGATNASATWDVLNNVGVYFTSYTKNIFRVGYNGTKYYVFINNVEKWSLESNLKVSFPNTNCIIGCHSWWGALSSASLYLTKFKIYVDGELVYSPTKPAYFLEHRKEGFDLSKFTIVGSPTITDEGIATYISGQNYVYIPPIDYTKPFAIRKIGFTQASTGANFYFINGARVAKDFGGFTLGFNGSTRKLRLFLGSTGNTWNISAPRESTTILELNKPYYVDLIYSGTNYTCILYDNNLNELERLVVNNSTPIYQSGNGIMIGSNYINATVYNGNIYLSNITIENDGEEIFAGAKYKLYAMRGM